MSSPSPSLELAAAPSLSAAATRCPSCGEPTRPGAKFCTRCGKRLPQRDETRPAPPTSEPAVETIAERLADERKLESPRAAYFQLGLQLIAAGRAGPAAEAFEQAAKEDGASPSPGTLAMGLGQAYAQAGASGRALRAYLEAALDLPNMFDPLIEAAFGALDAESAAAHFRWLTDVWLRQLERSSLSSGVRGLGLALFGAAAVMTGAEAQAIDRFSALGETEKNATWRAVLGRMSKLPLPPGVAAGEGERAFLLGRLAAALGQTDEALKSVDRALELGFAQKSGHRDAPAYALKGELLERLGRDKDAADSRLAAGKRYLWRNEAPEAIMQLDRALALDKNADGVCWWLADALLADSYLPEPPYADPDKVRRCLAFWDVAAKDRLPDPEHSWAYLTRAEAANQMGRLPGADRWERYWEIVAFVEQALLLDPAYTSSWVLLAQAHENIDNNLNALHATETALLCDPEDVRAIEQRIVLLANLARYADVRPLLAKWKAASSQGEGWANAIEAHIALGEAMRGAGERRWREGLAAADAARQAKFAQPWFAISRARLLRMAARLEDSRKEYSDLWARYEPKDVASRLQYAWAALMTNEADAIDQALSILAACAADRTFTGSGVQRYLGLGRLLRGDLGEAQEHLNHAVEKADPQREPEAALVAAFEADEVSELLAGRPYVAAARNMIERFKASIAARRNATPAPASALEEAQHALAACGDSTGWDRIGALATVARLSLEATKWREAEERYRSLREFPGRFFNAEVGLEQARYGLNAERAAASGESIAVPADGAPPADLARWADICDRRRNRERRRRPTRLFGQTGVQRALGVTPIAIETARNLEPFFVAEKGDLDPEVAGLIRGIRSELYDRLGFTMPGVRVRVNESFVRDGDYVLLVKEVPVVSGNIPANKRLCGTPETLPPGVKAEQGVNPATGRPCAWIDEADLPTVKDAGLQVWGPAECIVMHLHSVVGVRLSEFVGVQSVSHLLKARAEPFRASVLSAPGGLPRFASVIGALLAEQVPVKELAAICERHLTNVDRPTWEICEEIRCLDAVRKDLVGNTQDTPIYKLGDNFVSLIKGGVRRDGEAAALALEPEPTQRALAAIREAIAGLDPRPKDPALFVDDQHLRPFVRKLVELEFPHLAVLSRREAVAADSREVVATIEIDDA